jgi:uncharacterized LabA/DUF88 family protein
MRTVVYVDGFNFFYALHDVRQLTGMCFYWIDVYRFAEALVTTPPIGTATDLLVAMHYFTAVPAKDPIQKQQHLLFFEMTRAISPVSVHEGIHIPIRHSCKVPSGCGGKWKDYQEKETDVRLGVKMVSDAYEDVFDRAVLISSDGDFVPALELIRARFKHKEIVVVPPLGRPPNKKLLRYAHKMRTIADTDLQPYILRARVTGANGKTYSRPTGWVHKRIL